ncbi:sensor histidine kinase [Pseudonocardia lacus]|uniref:sensor histidine kinase n=1 Tax=Pseudonocardia lacus TaxID=2835865 RepID=UPI001BDC539B|nr:HAMP domain-containing sensor histidine kinase [Pseudonocardia lacus]
MTARLRGRRLHYRPVSDVLVVSGVGAVVAVLMQTEFVGDVLPRSAHDLLTFAAAGTGAGSAVLALFASRVLDDRRMAWIAAALVLYCAVVLPWSTLEEAKTGGAQRSPMLLVYLAAMVLLVVSVRPPRVLGAWGGWAVAAAGAGLGFGTLGLPPGSGLQAFTEQFVPTVAVLIGWTAAAVAFAAEAFRARSTSWLRLGLGLVVLAVAQLYRVASGASAEQVNLAFDGLRLVGLVVLVVGLAQMVQEGVGRLQARNWEQQDEIASAAVHLERAQEIAAERDHEMRNGLAGLAGITHLLSGTSSEGEHEALRHAVLTELDRLQALVNAGGADVPGAALAVTRPIGPGYSVPQVLTDRATLRQTAAGPGAGRLELRMQVGVRAAGSPDTLAQILTNLLANCDRHAPGAPITISAHEHDGRVRIEVRDAGPGLPPETAGHVLERGVHDEQAGGQGYGLAISARLAQEAGGDLTIADAVGEAGCVATLTLPSVAEVTSTRPPVAEDGPPVVSSAASDNH